MGPLGSNIEEERRVTHGLPQKNHGEVSAADRRKDEGDAQGTSSLGNGGNAVGDDLYRETVGNRGIVDGATTNIQSVSMEEGIQGRWK